MEFKIGDRVEWLMSSAHKDGRPAIGIVMGVSNDEVDVIFDDEDYDQNKRVTRLTQNTRLLKLLRRKKKPTIIVRIN